MNSDIVLRKDVGKAAWNRFVAQHKVGWFWHTWEWLEYCMDYEPCNDMSFALVNNGEIVSLVPLFTTRSTPAFAMGGGTYNAVPLLHDDTDYQTQMFSSISEVLKDVAITSPIYFRGSPLADDPVITMWDDASWKTQVIDLTKNESELESDLRKTYKPLIHNQIVSYKMTYVHGVLMNEYISAMRELHFRNAGRKTRSDKTWNHMAHWVEDGRGLVVFAYDLGTHEPMGYALAVIYKGSAYYASGARVAECGHGIQWELMRALKKFHVHEYEIGWQEHSNNEKESKIEFFKRGFGGVTKRMPAYLFKPVHSLTL